MNDDEIQAGRDDIARALYANHPITRQVERQRKANPRPDVTDFPGYGPDWTSYGANMQRNLQAQLMQPGDTGEAMVQKAMGMAGNFGLGGAIAGKTWFKGMYPHDYTKEVKDSAGKIVDRGPLIDPKDIRRSTPFPTFQTGEESLQGVKGFFSDSPDVASHFATSGGTGGAVYPVTLDAKRTYTIDAKGKKAGDVQFGQHAEEFRKAVRSGKYDAIEISNTADEGNVAVMLEGGTIKSLYEGRDAVARAMVGKR